MTKSIITIAGALSSIVAMILGIVGVFNFDTGGYLATFFLGVIFLIFFASFGGFKVFFPRDPQDRLVRPAGELTDQTKTKRLVTVGAEIDEETGKPLFGEREPGPSEMRLSQPIFDDDLAADSVRDHAPDPTPLFGEVLSEQLAQDNPVQSADDQSDDEDDSDEDVADTEASVDADTAEEAAEEVEAVTASIEDDESEAPGIVVDENPEWVADTDDSVELDSEADDSAELDGELETELVESSSVEDTNEQASDAAAELVAVEPVATDDKRLAQPASIKLQPAGESRAIGSATLSYDDNIELDEIDAESLAASLDALAPPIPSATATPIDYTPEPVVYESTGLSVEKSGTELPVAVATPAPLELHRYTSDEIMSVVKTEEGHMVDTLIDEGLLSTDGPLTDKDIRTMIFVAVSSTEMIDVLTTGQQQAVALNGGGVNALESGS